jgi:uncharacterized protein (DUF4415 family)
MAKQERIVRYSGEQIDAKLVRGEDQTDWRRVDGKTEADLATDTASDPAWKGIAEGWYADARAAIGPLMRPKENKRLVSIRYDADVVEFFKGQGRGWQARMNAVLRSFMERHNQ